MRLETGSADRTRQWAVILSPMGVIALGYGVQRMAGRAMGAWAWIPTMLVLWTAIAGLILWGGQGKPARLWLGRSRGTWVWSLLAVAVGLVSVREFLSHWRVLELLSAIR